MKQGHLTFLLMISDLFRTNRVTTKTTTTTTTITNKITMIISLRIIL